MQTMPRGRQTQFVSKLGHLRATAVHQATSTSEGRYSRLACVGQRQSRKVAGWSAATRSWSQTMAGGQAPADAAGTRPSVLATARQLPTGVLSASAALKSIHSELSIN